MLIFSLNEYPNRSKLANFKIIFHKLPKRDCLFHWQCTHPTIGIDNIYTVDIQQYYTATILQCYCKRTVQQVGL